MTMGRPYHPPSSINIIIVSWSIFMLVFGFRIVNGLQQNYPPNGQNGQKYPLPPPASHNRPANQNGLDQNRQQLPGGSPINGPHFPQRPQQVAPAQSDIGLSPEFLKIQSECAKKSQDEFSNRVGTSKLLSCCFGLATCECIKKRCNLDHVFRNSNAGECEKECTSSGCNEDGSGENLSDRENLQKCMQLPSNRSSWVIALIVIAVLILVGVTVTIGVVCWKKFRSATSSSKKQKKVSYAVGDNLTVSSHVHGDGKHRKHRTGSQGKLGATVGSPAAAAKSQTGGVSVAPSRSKSSDLLLQHKSTNSQLKVQRSNSRNQVVPNNGTTTTASQTKMMMPRASSSRGQVTRSQLQRAVM